MPEKPKTQSLCVISPCFNEVAVLALFYERLKKVLDGLSGYDYEILLVDDGSSDGTLDLLNRLHESDEHVSFLSLSRNFGHQIALTAGIDACDADRVRFTTERPVGSVAIPGARSLGLSDPPPCCCPLPPSRKIPLILATPGPRPL